LEDALLDKGDLKMPYVQRDKDGKIIIACIIQDGQVDELIDVTNPDFLDYISSSVSSSIKYFPSNTPEYEIKRLLLNPTLATSLSYVIKTLQYLKNNGVDIGPDGTIIVDAFSAINNMYPES
jgi:hypothetical protein